MVRARAFPVTPNGVGAVLVAGLALGGAFPLGFDVLLAFGVLVSVLVVGSAILVLTPVGDVRVRRSLPEGTVTVGDRITVRVELSGGLAARLSGARDRLPPALRLVQETGGVRQRTSTLLALRRGRHDLGPVQLTLRDPFGFFERTLSFGETATLVVLPERVGLTGLTGLLTAAGGGQGGRTTVHTATSAEDLSARPYATGDSIRRVNWRATARRDELMVRQEEEPTAPRAALFLDTSPSHWGEPDDEGVYAGFERAVALVAAAIGVLADRGYRVHVVTPGAPDLYVDGAAGPAQRDEALRALATVDLDHSDAALDAATATLSEAAAVIAVLGAVTDDHLPHYAALGRSAGSATALLPLGASDATLAQLRAAGWHCRTDAVTS